MDNFHSQYFTAAEFTRSQTATRWGVDNTPPPEAVRALNDLCANVLDPLRKQLGKAIQVTSGYRCAELNRMIGGAPTSQHTRGEAADIVVPGLDAQELFEFLRRSQIPVDQAILEFGEWVHVSWSATRQRNDWLIARRINGRTIYSRCGRNDARD